MYFLTHFTRLKSYNLFFKCEFGLKLFQIFCSRSATYNTVTGDCRISDMDRHTIAGTGEFLASQDDEFLENNCVDDPVRLCDFQLLENRIMKTVDSVYQVCCNIQSIKSTMEKWVEGKLNTDFLHFLLNFLPNFDDF